MQLSGAAAQAWGSEAYQSEIRLITGRTHQIRAQFSACGAPLLGDTLYGWRGGGVSFQGTKVQGKVVERVGAERIGLQARRLDISGAAEAFGSEGVSFDAGSPDWLV